MNKGKLYFIRERDLKPILIKKSKIVSLIIIVVSVVFLSATKIHNNKNIINNNNCDTVYVETDYKEHLRYSYLFDKIHYQKERDKKAFIYEVKAIAERVGIDYKWILFVFNAESGINPNAINNNSNAKGLFQVMPLVQKELNLDLSDTKHQLESFEKYLNYWGINKIKSVGDLYCIIFVPSWIDKDDKIIPSNIRDANAMYKHCKTVKEFKLYIINKYNNEN